MVPFVGERVWRVFWRLDARRTGNGYGANAISPSEIEALCRLSGERLRRWELDALDAMEGARLRWMDRSSREDDQVIEAQPVTPALVTALFG